MKTIFLIEDSWGGHHPTYLKIFTKTLLELGHQVIILCRKYNQWSCLYFRPLYLNFGQKFWSFRRNPLRQHAVVKFSKCKVIAVLD